MLQLLQPATKTIASGGGVVVRAATAFEERGPWLKTQTRQTFIAAKTLCNYIRGRCALFRSQIL